MRALVLLSLVGCNAVFGLDKTELQDAAKEFFDGPPDAPFGCPADGSAPRFASSFSQVLTHGACIAYNESTVDSTFSAYCGISGPVSADAISSGTIGVDGFAFATLDPAPPAGAVGKLAPEGDRLFIADASTGSGKITEYARAADPGAMPTMWGSAVDLVITPADSSIGDVGTPSSASPKRRMFYFGSQGPTEIEEQAPGQWMVVGVITAPKLTLTVSTPPNLSPDGLRIVFAGELSGISPRSGFLYSARAQLTDEFTSFVLIDTAPTSANDPFLRGDCSRLYFSGLGSVFYIVEIP